LRTGRAETLRGKSDTLTIKFTAKETIVKAALWATKIDRQEDGTPHPLMSGKEALCDILV